jgi:D-3-phosphoglycerate dehydrogenase / 2-oxoglutarate reductase
MKILHLDTNHPILIEKLTKAGFTNDENYTSSEREIKRVISNYDGIVIRSRFNIDRNFLDAASQLKFIARVGAGLESIDEKYAQERGVSLISAPEGNRNAVGEHTLGMILSLFNKLNKADHEVRNGIWERERNRGTELDGKVVGIIGYGNMGKAFAKKLKGFDCKVIFHDIKKNIGDDNAAQVSLEVLQETADILSLHTPWTPLTNNMVNITFIEKFQKPFWFINTSRGNCAVTADLVSALKSGRLLGAGLDVLEYEKDSFESLFDLDEVPAALQELLKLDNVLLSPHIAGWTIESKLKLANVIADKIILNFKRIS